MQGKGASTLSDDEKMKIPHVLTVAGSDSGAGAGIQAVIKACAARRVYCSTVVTAVTAQNTVGVQGVSNVPEDVVAEQLKSVLSDMQVDGALVVDPVIVSTSGDVLAAPSIISTFQNIVLVKGGDLPGSSDAPFDLLCLKMCSACIKTRNTLGTGCSLASCMAAELAKGYPVLSAVKVAKRFVETALDYRKEIVIGNELQGLFDHLLRLKNHSQDCHNLQPFNPSYLFLYAVTDSRINKREDAETKDFPESAKACLDICRSRGVPLLINDCVDVAIACDADGLHVGQSDMPAHVARTKKLLASDARHQSKPNKDGLMVLIILGVVLYIQPTPRKTISPLVWMA
ncbi:hypothetical protein DITRI_Ditri01bG0054700 [Diplodiscus trichospermus]